MYLDYLLPFVEIFLMKALMIQLKVGNSVVISVGDLATYAEGETLSTDLMGVEKKVVEKQ